MAKSADSPACYALVHSGLEEIAAEEIRADFRGDVKKAAKSIVVFRVPEIDRHILNLRTTEDVYLFLDWSQWLASLTDAQTVLDQLVPDPRRRFLGTPPAMGQAIAERIPGATLHVFDNASHLSVAEMPDEFAQKVGEFIARV